jgi:malate dehydrogenase (oxaloacetate-decarboxylating)
VAEKIPGVAYSVTIRAEYSNEPGMLGRITSAIGEVGGDIEAVDLVHSSRNLMARDITVNAMDVEHGQRIVARVRKVAGVRVASVSDPTFLMHLRGKLEVHSKYPLKTRNDLSMAYTPGVARVCMAIYDDPEAVWKLTVKGNSVAVVTDGTAVLGLGDIGPMAAMPVMEGKAMLFKELAGVDAWPICLDTKDPDAIVEAVKNLAPVFGGINLEDISAPRCFYIEDRLREEIDIPVFHDDQHGTAVVAMAGLFNAVKLVNKPIESLKAVMTGVGAGGVATAKMMMEAGVTNIIGCDRVGVLHRDREYGDNQGKQWFADNTNPDNFKGTLLEAMSGADLFIGLSGPNVITVEHVKAMNRDPIVFAMANPDPEILPEEAGPHVRVMATGRSDYPNQINNALCFPGFFRGMLDVRASGVNSEMKMAAAKAIAMAVPTSELSEEYIIPNVFDRAVARNVAREVAAVAQRTGVARKGRRNSKISTFSRRR